MKWFRTIVLPAFLISGCVATEYVTHQRVVPTGRVKTLREYLAWRPSSDEFASVVVGGNEHVIAYGLTRSLLLASGPSAYVFNASGRLVDWSADIGDDPQFDDRWTACRLRAPGRALGRAAVEALARTEFDE